MIIKNLYTRREWDTYYTKEKQNHLKVLNGILIPYDIFLCDRILRKYLPPKRGLKICEIGCGDGKLLKKISKWFGYEPYGIEYAKPAILEAKKRGINIIEGDVFNENLQNTYKEYFDIVFSYGFIEHIEPVEKAIDVHLKLLKPGGIFFVQIPRFKGFNYLKIRIFRPDLLKFHNLKIMEPEKLKILFSKWKFIKEIKCQMYGTFKIRLPILKKDWRYFLLKFLYYFIEIPLGIILKLFLGDRGIETKFFSPCIIFIGKKLK